MPSTLPTFLTEITPSQQLWALQEPNSEDWVVLDSIEFENTDVMPLFSSAARAKVHCVDEWQGYVPTAISLAGWLEFWLDDLHEDGVMIGVNWTDDTCLELEVSEFSQALASIEKLS
jgi:hypothetical protein